jgi:multicomponent Na+:H+ antiporter subunit E
LLAIFIREFLLSNWSIIKECLRSGSIQDRCWPAIIDFPLTVQRPRSIALLSQLITLTPGTLSLEVSSDLKYLRIHAYFGSDPEKIIEDIRQAFERPIQEIFE